MQTKLKLCQGECGQITIIWKQFSGKRYCRNCWSKIKPQTPLKQSALPKSQKPIAKESDKRKKEHAIYTIMRIQFLKDHPMCFMAIPGICSKVGTTIQHKKGRGKYYLDIRYWGSACMGCHHYCDTHPQESIENGWALERLTKDE